MTAIEKGCHISILIDIENIHNILLGVKTHLQYNLINRKPLLFVCAPKT